MTLSITGKSEAGTGWLGLLLSGFIELELMQINERIRIKGTDYRIKGTGYLI
jgi:hypothetical protein